MFFITQLIGIFVISQYSPQTTQTTDAEGNLINVTSYNLPYGMDPPPEIQPASIPKMAAYFAIIFAIAVGVMFILMKYNAELLLRLWFFVVVALAIGIFLVSVFYFLNIFSQEIKFIFWTVPLSWLIALIISFPVSFTKIFRKNIIIHNLTELIIYPGIAVIFVTLILSWTASPVLAVAVILILISLYDMYAVWHAGFMQKMAKYQIQKLKLFTGFFVPYLNKNQKQIIAKTSKAQLKNKK